MNTVAQPTPMHPENYAVVLAARGYPLPWLNMMSIITAANNVRVARLSMPKDTTPGDAALIARAMADSCNAVPHLCNSFDALTEENERMRVALEHVIANIELVPEFRLTTLDIAGIRAALKVTP